MKRLLKGGRVIDPVNGLDGQRDVLIEDNLIKQVDKDLPVDGATVVEIPEDYIVCPGFIDMHVHLREPGQEHKETVATGTASAVAGGFTAVACMPNTNPINDDANVTTYILNKAKETGLARVYPIGAVSRRSDGDVLSDIADLKRAGCVALSDDGRPVATALLMRRALEYASMFDMPLINHCEDPSLKGEGVAHEGYQAATLGLRGIPGAAEAIMVERDALLSEITKASVHVAHMSARESLRAVRKAKEADIQITCEVAPHHFTLTDDSLASPTPYDTNTKMNPPLREAVDHAPHHYDEKNVEFDLAPFGIVGLETAVPLVFDRLVHTGRIGLSRMVELLSVNPAKILRVPGGTLKAGGVADIVVLAPDLSVQINTARLHSLSKNTPFDGWKLKGGVVATIVGGVTSFVNKDLGLKF